MVSTPVGCEALFGLDPRELRGRVVALEAWSSAPVIRKALRRLMAQRGLSRLLELLESSLGRPPSGFRRIAEAVGQLRNLKALIEAWSSKP